MSPILHYLQTNKFSLEKGEARRVQKQVVKYTLLSGKLYKIGKASPMLRCLGEHETTLVLVEVHKGAYSSHICEKALTHKLLRAGYYWYTLIKDNITFVKRCDQCQRHADLHHAPKRTCLFDDLAMAFLSMGRGHSRLVPLGIETT